MAAAAATACASCEQQEWFWEKFQSACATQALALDLKLPSQPDLGLVIAVGSKAVEAARSPSVSEMMAGVSRPTSTPALGEAKPRTSPSGASPKGGRPRPRVGGAARTSPKAQQQPEQPKEQPLATAKQAEELFSQFVSEGFSKKSLEDFQKAIKNRPAQPQPSIAPLELNKSGKLGTSSSMPCLDSEASTRAGSLVSTARSMARTPMSQRWDGLQIPAAAGVF